MLAFMVSNADALARAALSLSGSTAIIVLGIAAVAVGLGLVAAIIRYPFLGIAMILLSIAVSGYRVEVSRDAIQLAAFGTEPDSLTLRPEYLFVPLGACSLVLGQLLRRERVWFGRAAWLGAWIGLNILSSVLRSPALTYSLRMIYFYVVGALAYLGVLNYLWDRSRLRSGLLLTTGLVAAEAVFALFFGGRWLDVGVVRLHGTFQEPVVFSSFMVPMSLLLLAWGMGPSTSAASLRCRIPVAYAGLLGSVFSMSRASWGMAVFGVGLILFFVRRWRQVRPSRLAAGAAVGGALALVLMFLWIRFAPTMYSSFEVPFPVTADTPETGAGSLVARLKSDTWLWRADVAREVLSVVRGSPLIGLGTLTFGQTHDVLGGLSPTPSNGWIPTASLLVLHDTGVIGLVLFGIFLLAIAFDTVRAMRTGDVEGRSLALGGLAGLLAWVGMEQTSTTMILGIGWAYLGLVSAVATVARASPPLGMAVASVGRPKSVPAGR